MAFTIYMATCPEGRHYVGCTSKTAEARWAQFAATTRTSSWNGKYGIHDAIRKFGGRAAFTLTVLAVVERPEDAAAVETLMIDRYNAVYPGGHNTMRSSHYCAARVKRAA